MRDPAWDAISGTRLESDDVEGGHPDLTEDAVNTTLAGVRWADSERPFVPHFGCWGLHLDRWTKWIAEQNRHVRLLRWVHDQRRPDEERAFDREIAKGPIARDLDSFAGERAKRLRFEPEPVVRAWLGQDAPEGPVDE